MNFKTLFCWFIVALSVSSCSSKKTEDKLVGTWVLDSILSANGGFYKSDADRKTLIFKYNGTYSYESWNGDVGNKSTGLYRLIHNSNRNTITFIADLQVLDKADTSREYMNYDIISLTDKALKVTTETKFITRDSLPYIVFNKQYIYKRWR